MFKRRGTWFCSKCGHPVSKKPKKGVKHEKRCRGVSVGEKI